MWLLKRLIKSLKRKIPTTSLASDQSTPRRLKLRLKKLPRIGMARRWPKKGEGGALAPQVRGAGRAVVSEKVPKRTKTSRRVQESATAVRLDGPSGGPGLDPESAPGLDPENVRVRDRENVRVHDRENVRGHDRENVRRRDRGSARGRGKDRGRGREKDQRLGKGPVGPDPGLGNAGADPATGGGTRGVPMTATATTTRMTTAGNRMITA